MTEALSRPNAMTPIGLAVGSPDARRDVARLTRTLDMVIDALRDTADALAALRGQDDRTVRAARRAIELARLA